MPERSESNRWLAQAERDLDDAEYNLEGDRHNLACFVAQQAAEKALKAYLYHQGAEDVWGHSVAELCDDAAEFDEGFADLNKTAASLDKYYIPTRYPNGLPGGIPSEAFIKADALSAVAIARSVIDFVKGRIAG